MRRRVPEPDHTIVVVKSSQVLDVRNFSSLLMRQIAETHMEAIRGK